MISPTAELPFFNNFSRKFNTMRCFPEGERNCYTLKPKQGKNNRYLIRAFFLYGNYDGKNQPPYFELHIGVNLWEKIHLFGPPYMTEIIYTPSTDIINVCIVTNGSTIPCISTLELRPLNNSIYQTHQLMLSSDIKPPLLLFHDRLHVIGSFQPPSSPDNFFFGVQFIFIFY